MTLVLAILNALVAIPKIAGYVEAFVGALSTWWMQRQTADTLSAISDVAALQARAKTDEDRYAVAQKYQDILSRSRTLS